MAALSQARASIRPEVPRSLPKDVAHSGFDAPSIVGFGVAAIPGKALAIRDGGIGWLWLFYGDDDATRLADLLLARPQRR